MFLFRSSLFALGKGVICVFHIPDLLVFPTDPIVAVIKKYFSHTVKSVENFV